MIFPDYAFGIDSKEQLLGYCEGQLKDFMMEEGLGGGGAGGPSQPAGRPSQPVRRGEQEGTGSREPQVEQRETMREEGRYGIEYDRIGCNDKDGSERAKEQCRYACEIKVPGCGPWIVCADGPTSCPPSNYCEIRPEACPNAGQGSTMCSADDDWAFQECNRRGGNPRSGLDTLRGCEVYTGCDMSVLEEKKPVAVSAGWCPDEDDKRFECMNRGGAPLGEMDPDRGCEKYTGCDIR